MLEEPNTEPKQLTRCLACCLLHQSRAYLPSLVWVSDCLLIHARMWLTCSEHRSRILPINHQHLSRCTVWRQSRVWDVEIKVNSLPSVRPPLFRISHNCEVTCPATPGLWTVLAVLLSPSSIITSMIVPVVIVAPSYSFMPSMFRRRSGVLTSFLKTWFWDDRCGPKSEDQGAGEKRSEQHNKTVSSYSRKYDILWTSRWLRIKDNERWVRRKTSNAVIRRANVYDPPHAKAGSELLISEEVHPTVGMLHRIQAASCW